MLLYSFSHSFIQMSPSISPVACIHGSQLGQHKASFSYCDLLCDFKKVNYFIENVKFNKNIAFCAEPIEPGLAGDVT